MRSFETQLLVLKTQSDARLFKKTQLGFLKGNSSPNRGVSTLKCIYIYAMTKPNGAEQEEEELDHCCPVFHRGIQIAFFKCSYIYTVRPVQRTEQKTEVQ